RGAVIGVSDSSGSLDRGACPRWHSIGFRKIEHAFGEVAQDELRAYRRDAWDKRFPEIPFDMVLLRISHPAMCHDRLFAGAKPSFAGKILGGVGFSATGAAVIVQPGSLHRHQIGRLELGPAFRQRMLYRLVLADRPAKDHTFTGVSRRT